MKKILLVLIVSLPIFLLAQETEKPKFGLKFSGFLRNDVVFNTRQVVSARGENQFVLAPKPIVEDRDGEDINAASNLSIIGIAARLRAKISGPDAFGAKTSGLIEGDFFGRDAATKFAFRLRHAFVKLDWDKTQLLVGQYWHPSFATDCYPGTVSFSSGVPFNPLSRNPQIRLTRKLTSNLSIFAVAMGQGHFKSKEVSYINSKGVLAFHSNPRQNSSMPEMHLQVQFRNEMLAAGIGADYQVLRPRLQTDALYVTSETIGALSFMAYAKLSLKPLTVKWYGSYGQCNDNMVMMGGYAITEQTYSQEQLDKNFVEYTAYDNLSTWIDFETTGKTFKYGLFAGYAQNLGAAKEVRSSSYVGRWGNVNSMYRIAPRVTYAVNKFKLGFEVEYSAVDYADGSENGIDAFGKVTNFQTADNIKVMCSVAYMF